MPTYDGERFAPPAPVARVDLRNRAHDREVSGVPMLIDSGSDVTLIPAAAAHHLGLEVSREPGISLVGFDGTASSASSAEVELFLLDRLFRGRYVLIDAAWGVLGRDILNHLSLRLDGPRLTWNLDR